MELKEIKKIITLCKKEGLLVFKTSEVELHFNPLAPIPKKRGRKVQASTEQIPTEGYTEEEILSWSVQTAGMND